MEKFTKIEKNNDKEGVDMEGDMDNVAENTSQIVILPYFKDDGHIFLRYEKFPIMSGNKTSYHLSCIKGDYNDKQNDIQNLRRVLFDETGIVLNNMYQIEFNDIIFKDNTSEVNIIFVC